MSKIYTAVDQLIGHTPLLELSHIEAEEKLEAKIIAKLEYLNPAGSVKDRVAKAIIDDAEAKGILTKKSTILETQVLDLLQLRQPEDTDLLLLCQTQCL